MSNLPEEICDKNDLNLWPKSVCQFWPLTNKESKLNVVQLRAKIGNFIDRKRKFEGIITRSGHLTSWLGWHFNYHSKWCDFLAKTP